MAVEPEVARVVNAYTRVEAALRAAVLTLIASRWRALSGFRDADADEFVAAVVPIITGAQVQTAALTDAYLAQVEQAVLRRPTRPVGIARQLVSDLTMRGVDAVDVYRRPIVTVRAALADGVDMPAASARGLARATNTAATDLQLAKTHTAREVLSNKDHVVGHRRVLKGHSCALCIVASTQRYHKSELQRIHPACDCDVMPIYAEKDPGHVIDPDRLGDIHDRIAERFGAATASARGSDSVAAYKDVLVTHEHGELGPILAVRGQHFTGPAEVPA